MTTNPRMCVGCRRRDSRKNLVRVVCVDSTLVVDEEAQYQGRGAWIHAEANCCALAVRPGVLERALRVRQLDSGALRQWTHTVQEPGSRNGDPVLTREKESG
ncbi:MULTISPECIES: YlxR family protein [unclassified Actinobaculum]|uniref:YlxR family protein n=1 Tax=unclassified Actinobaculum TaxID=2609299 RepID=UPI000D526B39|nr:MULTISPECIES: YlxR family protein [unclassified Actinobaculum]AWE42635.1 DUF448 domain-containing protein [Actinobaculum sp. 313]RTE47974.1 YlxR family protein [Actinobaculum sp. 352]